MKAGQSDEPESWENLFTEAGAIWRYCAGGLHAADVAGKRHVDYYFNSNYVVNHPKLLQKICTDVFLPELERGQVKVDWVLSYPPFGLPVAFCLAELINCRFAYSEKEGIRFNVGAGDKVLLVADDIYTGSSLITTVQTLSKCGASICDLIMVLANLSGNSELIGRRIVSALNHPIGMWEAGECPLCEDGSEAVGARSNWQRLLNDSTQMQSKTGLLKIGQD